jgi:nucleotide-binding universal stress UspA family protein
MWEAPQTRSGTTDYLDSKNIFNRLLVATDFSPASDTAFEYAASIAIRYDAQIYVVHVIDSGPFDVIASESKSSVLAQVEEQARQKIECMLTTRGVAPEKGCIVVTEGIVPDALNDLIRQHQIDLAVLGTHGRRAFKKLLMGSVTEEIFRMALCAVLNIGPNIRPLVRGPELQHILYPVEVAPDRSEAAKYAVSITEHYGGKLTLMNVREDVAASANQREKFPMPVESWIDDHISRGSGLRSRVYFESGSGPAAEAILEYASDAAVDLIVLGLHPLDPIIAAHLPKPDTAYEIVSRAPCPVLTVR